MLCLKKRRTYSFTQGVRSDVARRTNEDNHRYEGSLNMAITTLPRKNRSREERPSRMVLTVTEDTPADMLAGSMELLVQLPRDHHLQTQRVTVQRSTPMMDLLVQIATAHKLAASSYTLQAIGERGMVLPHQPNTPIGALDALQLKLLPKQGTFVPRKNKQASQPFETTFRLQVHLPRNQLYVSRVSPKMNLGEILDEVCREKDLDKNKYELRHPANLETLDLSLSLQDYHLQEVTLYAKQGRTLGSALSTQDIMALQRQEERRRQQAKQGVFGFVFKKSKEGSLSTDSLGGRSASPARSDETGRSTSPLQPPSRPQRKRRPAPKPPIQAQAEGSVESAGDSSKDKVVISHSRNSSDSSGYHEASVLSDNPDSAGRFPETLPRRNKAPQETPRKLAQTSQSSKSLCNLATVSATLSHGISNTSLSSTGLRKKRTAPPPPVTRPLSSAISTQALERIVDSEESLTSDMDPSKPPSDIGAPSKANSDIEERPKASSDIGVATVSAKLSSSIDFTQAPGPLNTEMDTETLEPRHRSGSGSGSMNVKLSKKKEGAAYPAPVDGVSPPVDGATHPVDARTVKKRVGEPGPRPKPRTAAAMRPEPPRRKVAPPSTLSRTLSSSDTSTVVSLSSNASAHDPSTSTFDGKSRSGSAVSSCRSSTEVASNVSVSEDEVFLPPEVVQCDASVDCNAPNILDKERGSVSLYTKTENNAVLRMDDDKENIEVSGNENNRLRRKDHDCADSEEHFGQEKKQCAVISMMPKCERLLNGLVVNNTVTQNREREAAKEVRKARIPRTASKSNDFEVNSLERQKRHLTSHAEDITFALNLNVASSVGLRSTAEQRANGDGVQEREVEPDDDDDVDVTSLSIMGAGMAHCAGAGVSDTNLSETDVLLQKVSDTLTNSLPAVTPTSTIELPVTPLEMKSEGISVSKETGPEEKRGTGCPEGIIMSTSTPNLTVNSQQDTSDYVSAADEDLAVTDWEYQLPAPPSAFRDSSASPVFDNFEMITPTPESFRDPVVQETGIEKQATQVIKSEGKKEPHPMERCSIKQKKPMIDLRLKKEVIDELENRIGTLPQTAKDPESRRVSANPSSTPKVAPVDNTLSNFTITTYSRQKSLNIFEAAEQANEKPKLTSADDDDDDRFVRSFATLSRNGRSSMEDKLEKSNCCKAYNNVEALQTKGGGLVSEGVESERKLEPKTMQTGTLQRWQHGKEKANIQRSKSYVSVCEKPNLQAKIQEEESARNEKNLEMNNHHGLMKKATSVSTLNATSAANKSNEKFSQWRENILKRQENPTKEKQLQSLQVLKSILPQLKNAQQAEENVAKESSNSSTVLSEKTSSETRSNEHSMRSNEVTARVHRAAPSSSSREEKKTDPVVKTSTPESSTKRYTYSGPPTINLGSWSERPSVNVQIKMDTDYKFGRKPANNNNNNKTIVSINGGVGVGKDETDATAVDKENSNSNFSKNKIEVADKNRREPDELTKKLINHTTASSFKKTVLNKVMNNSEAKVNLDKPVVTGVELKKNAAAQQNNKQQDDNNDNNNDNDNVIDTSPVNFKELAKAFGQDVYLRPKPKRSSLVGGQRAVSQLIENDFSRQNGHLDSEQKNVVTNGHRDNNCKARRFTSVVGIQAQNQMNGINSKGSKPMPVVKGFRTLSSNTNGGQNDENSMTESSKAKETPRPPTMPVITGVTLKSARPKSMPVQMDTRDVLLESIRNFGGRENLKSATERC